MNILIVNQSVVDMCASFFTLLTAVVKVDGTRMSRDSIYDQFVCHIWLTRQPLFCFIVISTYGIVLMALDRYVAVVHPVWQKENVRTSCVNDVITSVKRKFFYILLLICLFVCLSVVMITQYLQLISRNRHGPIMNRLDFGTYPNLDPNPGPIYALFQTER